MDLFTTTSGLVFAVPNHDLSWDKSCFVHVSVHPAKTLTQLINTYKKGDLIKWVRELPPSIFTLEGVNLKYSSSVKTSILYDFFAEGLPKGLPPIRFGNSTKGVSRGIATTVSTHSGLRNMKYTMTHRYNIQWSFAFHPKGVAVFHRNKWFVGALSYDNPDFEEINDVFLRTQSMPEGEVKQYTANKEREWLD